MRTILFAVLFSCILGLNPASTHQARAGEEGLITVVAQGMGKDSEAAHRSALKSAVEQALGSLIDSKVMIENDEVIEDKILSHSGGFVESHTILEGPDNTDGMVTVKIAAKVRRTRLVSQLESEKIIVQKVDGLSLKGAVVTKKEDHAAGAEMVKEMMKGYPENVLSLKIAEGPRVDDSGKKVIVKVRLEIDAERMKALIASLEELFEQASVRKPKRHRTKVELKGMNNDRYKAFRMLDFETTSLKEKHHVFLMTKATEDNSLFMWKEYVLSPELHAAFLSGVRGVQYGLELYDEDGDLIDSYSVKSMPNPHCYMKNNQSTLYMFPFLGEYDGSNREIGVPGGLTFTVTFDKLFPDEIGTIDEVKLFFK